MTISAPAYEATHGTIAALLGNVDFALRAANYTARNTFDVSNLAAPITTLTQTSQFAVDDVTTGVTRNFEVVVTISELTSGAAPAYTENVQ